MTSPPRIRSLLTAIWQLTRFQEFVYFVVVCTLLGAASAHASFGWRLMWVIAANWLAVGFAFMFNDVEDAPDDAMDPTKAMRNPVSAGALSSGMAKALSAVAALGATVPLAFLGFETFLWWGVTVPMGYFYSARGVRWKAVPVLDLISHALGLAGCQFMAAYLAFDHPTGIGFLWPLMFVMSASAYGQLFNQLRDFAGDSNAGITNTTAKVGPKAASLLMYLWLAVAAVCGVVSFFVILRIPWWVILIGLLAAALFSWRPFLQSRSSDSAIVAQGRFQKPLEAAATLALVIWFVSPRILPFLAAWRSP